MMASTHFSAVPISAAEIEELGADYALELQQLTFNSKPIITNLTILAQENAAAATAISTAIEKHIQKAAPTQKLPSLYLLDSIVKNVGEPYRSIFAQNLYTMFMAVYSVVDNPTRKKLEDLFQTWKVPPPNTQNSGPVFPPNQLRKIDYALSKIKSALLQVQQRQQQEQMQSSMINRPIQAAQSGHQYRHPTPAGFTSAPSEMPAAKFQPEPAPYPFPSVPSLHPPQYEGQMTWQDQRPSEASYPSYRPELYGGQASYPQNIQRPNPNEHFVNSLVHEVSSITKNVEYHLSIYPGDEVALEQLYALRELRTILCTSILPVEQLYDIRNQLQSISSQFPVSLRLNQYPQNRPQIPNVNMQIRPPTVASSQPAPFQQPVVNNQAAPTSHSASAQAGDLLSKLQNAGLLALDKTSSLSEMLQPPDFQTASLTKKRPHLISILFTKLPLQCKTCGCRFLNDSKGSKRRDDHLDWHFHVNKRLRENVMFEKARNWYLNEEFWISLQTEDSAADEDDPFNNKLRKQMESNEIEKDPRLSFIIAPLEASKTQTPCPICQEKFIAQWNDEVDDWVWYNCVTVNAIIYHATCFQETKLQHKTKTAQSVHIGSVDAAEVGEKLVDNSSAGSALAADSYSPENLEHSLNLSYDIMGDNEKLEKHEKEEDRPSQETRQKKSIDSAVKVEGILGNTEQVKTELAASGDSSLPPITEGDLTRILNALGKRKQPDEGFDDHGNAAGSKV